MQCLFQRKFPDIHCAVTFIAERVEHFTYAGNEKASILLDRVLTAAKISDSEYFSLQFLDRHKRWQWLRHQKPLFPQWRDSVADHSLPVSGSPTFHLRLAVKFYPNDPCRVADVNSRYFLFLQVRSDMEQRRMLIPSEDLFVELCGMILQSDLGDSPVTDLSHLDRHLSLDLTPPLRQKIFQAHACMRGRVPDAAEYMFLDKVKWLDAYGSVSTEVFDDRRNPCLLCLRPTSVYVERTGRKVLNVFWPSVTGFAVRKCCLQMKVRDKSVNMHSFFTASKEDARHLWKLCEEHHAFFKKNFEIRLMRSSSSSASVARMRTTKKSGRRESFEESDFGSWGSPPSRSLSFSSNRNFDEENRTMVRASARPAHAESNDNGSVLSAQTYSGGYASSAPNTPIRRPSIVSDHLAPRFHDPQRSPATPQRVRAVHLSDVESDSYFNRSRQFRAPSHLSQDTSDQNSRRPSTSAMSPFQNGLNGSLHSLQSDPTGGPPGQRRVRRRRARPSSPPGKAGPPPELLHHILFEPIEPPEDAQDIPYTVVRTNAEPFRIRYSPRMKQRGRSWLKPAPPTTEILPHASGPVPDVSGEKMPYSTASAVPVEVPVRPVAARPTAPQNSPYASRGIALSPVEAINHYASTLRAKQKDLLLRGAVSHSPKSSRRPPPLPQHHPPNFGPPPPPPPPHAFLSSAANSSYSALPPALHNASYQAAVKEHSINSSPGRAPPRRHVLQDVPENQRVTLL